MEAQKIIEMNPLKLILNKSLSSRTADVEVVFGAPSLDCDGFGICRIDALPFATSTLRTRNCNCRINTGRGRLIFYLESSIMLKLNKDSIHQDTIKKQFSNTLFNVEESYELNAKSIWSDLSKPHKLIFHAGKHLLFEDRQHIVIIFSGG